MHLLRRILRFLSRAGFVAAAAIALLWILGPWLYISSWRSPWWMTCRDGSIKILHRSWGLGESRFYVHWQHPRGEWWAWPRAEGLFRPGMTLVVPLWIPLIATGGGAAILSLIKPVKRGHCPRCDYDLRGLAPGSPCPECGRAPPSRAAP